MQRRISIIGSTGSIGLQALDVARNLNIKVDGISANQNIDILEQQAREFKPKCVAINGKKNAFELKERLKGLKIDVLEGADGLNAVATVDTVDTVVTSVVGISGLIPTINAIKHNKNVALANKETLVAGGEIIMDLAKEKGVKIIPVDSEHSAIFQCLEGNNISDVNKIILTASGGPFRTKTKEEMVKVTRQEALIHPNWGMGNKITIDSATMMNKGLEVIEAKWLFGIDIKNINVVVHPQSIIHSMVEYKDGSIIAQLGPPDMRIPIQFALTYPDRKENEFPKLDLIKVGSLTFENPDFEKFPALQLAFEALKIGGTMPTVLNASNEILVDMFLRDKITFMDIPKYVGKAMEEHSIIKKPVLDNIIEVDAYVREYMKSIIKY